MNKQSMNEFGGDWTEEKITAFMKYVRAYLEIMKDKKFFRLLYFDGFAGSGTISPDEDPTQFIQGVASQVLSISTPREFDIYLFVEKNPDYAECLKELIDSKYSTKRVRVAVGDCNDKLVQLGDYMRHPKQKDVRGLAFIDPYGMQLNWSTWGGRVPVDTELR